MTLTQSYSSRVSRTRSLQHRYRRLLPRPGFLQDAGIRCQARGRAVQEEIFA